MFSKLTRVLISLAVAGGACLGGVVGGPAAADVSGEWMDTFTIGPVGAGDLHAVASDAGDLAVVWERGGAIELSYDRPDAGFGAKVVVSPTESYDPRAAYDATGRLLVVWSSVPAGGPTRLMARVLDTADVWSDPVQLASRPYGGIWVRDVAVNAAGEAVIGWMWQGRARVTRGTLGGSWTTSAPWRKTLSIDVAIGDGGHAAAMLQGWVGELGDESTLTFAVARQTPAGVWGPTELLQTVRQGPPWVGPGGVAVDAQGVTTVAWQRVAPGGTTVVARRARADHAFRPLVVLAAQPTRTESPVRVLATPSGVVQVAWVHNWVAAVKTVRRPVGGPWSEATLLCPGEGVVAGWDIALADNGQALVTVARSDHFAGLGTWSRVTTKTGVWRALTPVASFADGPRVAINNNWAVVGWIGPLGVRLRVNEG